MKTIAPPGLTVPTTAPKPKKSKNRPMKPMIRFYGPVQVLLLDARGSYCKTVWCSLTLGLANVMIGAVNMAALMYMATSGDAHVFICTFAYHFFSVQAILSLNYTNGWSTMMRYRHRKFLHILLQICGMTVAVAGTTLVCVSKGVSGSAHGVTGIITAVLAGLSLLSGTTALLTNKTLKLIHMALGIPTFTMSSVSLVLGFLTAGFARWATAAVVYITVTFVVFYTVLIVVNILLKCIAKI